MGYCPDCGWDGYLEGVSKPCGGLGGGPDPDYPDDEPLDDIEDYAREERDLSEMSDWRA